MRMNKMSSSHCGWDIGKNVLGDKIKCAVVKRWSEVGAG